MELLALRGLVVRVDTPEHPFDPFSEAQQPEPTAPARRYGISISRTSIGRVRRATYGGSSASAASESGASTRHQSVCPPLRQVDAGWEWRNGLSKPVQAAKAAAQSVGSC